MKYQEKILTKKSVQKNSPQEVKKNYSSIYLKEKMQLLPIDI